MTLQLKGLLAGSDRPELGDACPIDRASSLVARRSTILLLREASYGTTRFDEFVTRTGLTESVTANQLRNLVSEGLLVKVPYQEPSQRQRFEYALTEAGHDLVPIVMALGEWGEKHRPRTNWLGLTHADCGARVHMALTCEAGHAVREPDVVVSLEHRQP
ncbi:winged helix-turn-helix transcriptional regulator [Kribbella sp. CA-253562]|uniref:winged helix-turn-helix transcriptional regulator n=1 Tax=Kribbella sp. CA-253562 TaxID=3239942 RepID=UPI003D8FE8FD